MSTDLRKKSIDNILYNTFMSNQKKNYYIEKYKNVYPFAKNNIVIYLCIASSNPDKYKKLINNIFNRVYFMRNFFNNNKKLEIWVYPSRCKKLLPTKSNILTCDNINSGSTVTYVNSSNNGIITLWRSEELLKVLVHEIIHAFGVDKNYPEPSEAHTELRSLIINIYLILSEKKKSFNDFNTYLEKEKEFSLNQCYKLQNYEAGDTNANAYYNEKTRLLFNIPEDEWGEYVNKNNKNISIVPNNSLRLTISDLL